MNTSLACFIAVVMYSSSSLANDKFTRVRGFHAPIIPEYAHSFSPIYGEIMVGSGLLENMRFRGFYGAHSVEGIPCGKNAKETAERIKNGDCPQNSTAAVLQMLFPSPDGNHLVPNQKPSEPITYLTPQEIGEILNQLYELRQSQENLFNPRFESKFKERMIEGILRKLKPEIFKSYDIKALKKQTPADEQHPLANKRTWKRWVPFVDQLYRAFLDSRKGQHEQYYPYPAYTLEYSLMGFMLMKFPNKSSMPEYYQSIADKVRPNYGFLTKNESELNPAEKTKLEEWLQADYSESIESFWREEKREIGDSSGIQKIQKLMDHIVGRHIGEVEYWAARDPELSYILGRTWQLWRPGQYPQLISYGLTPHASQIESNGLFSDCVETALLNVFKILLFDPTGSWTVKENLEKVIEDFKLPIDLKKDKIVRFFSHFETPTELQKEEARKLWSGDILAGLSGVSYRPLALPKNQGIPRVVSIMPTQRNILHTLAALLGDQVLHQAEVPNSKKWDRICELFSRNGVRKSKYIRKEYVLGAPLDDDYFRIDWKATRGKIRQQIEREEVDRAEDDLNIEFSINGVPRFSLDIFGHPYHHVGASYLSKTETSRLRSPYEIYSDSFAAAAAETGKENPDLLAVIPHINNGFVEFSYEYFRSRFPDHQFFPNFFFRAAGPSVEDAFTTLDFLTHSLYTADDFDVAVEKILSKLPLNDEFTVAQVQERLYAWTHTRKAPLTGIAKELWTRTVILEAPWINTIESAAKKEHLTMHELDRIEKAVQELFKIKKRLKSEFGYRPNEERILNIDNSIRKSLTLSTSPEKDHLLTRAVTNRTNRDDDAFARQLIMSGEFPNGHWKSPLREAMSQHKWELFQLMISQGADINFRDENGDTALISASDMSEHLEPKYLQALLSHGAETNVIDNHGRSPLRLAANTVANDEYRFEDMRVGEVHQGIESLKLLTEAGADLNAKDLDGKSAWDIIFNDRWVFRDLHRSYKYTQTADFFRGVMIKRSTAPDLVKKLTEEQRKAALLRKWKETLITRKKNPHVRQYSESNLSPQHMGDSEKSFKPPSLMSLMSLNLSGTKIEGVILEQLPPGLRDLNLSNIKEGLMMADLYLISNLKELETLNLSMTEIDDEELLLLMLENMPQLKEVHLKNCITELAIDELKIKRPDMEIIRN